MAFVSGGVGVYFGPPVLGAPDDLEAVIVDFLDGAVHELDIAVQEIDSRTIAAAVIAAKQRHVRVRLILEGDYLVEAPALGDPWAVAGPLEENRTIYNALLRAGVDVITDLNPAIFHQKFVVRDPGRTTAAVLTGSTNFTLTDTGKNTAQAPLEAGNNLNHVVILRGQRATAQYAAEFERLRSGTFGTLHERRDPRPAEFELGGMRVKPVFAPDQGPEMEIMKQMLKARSSVDFAIFTFALSSGIDDTMLRMAPPALGRLRGVLDRVQGSQAWAATQPLVTAGVELFENAPGTGVRKVHHKLMVIDSQLVIAGSFNYTDPANTLNDENIVVLGDLEATDPAARQAQGALAEHTLHEIERIITDLSRPVAVPAPTPPQP